MVEAESFSLLFLLRWRECGDQKREAGVQSSVQGRLSGQHHPRSWGWREKGMVVAAVLQMTPDLLVLVEKLYSSLLSQRKRQRLCRLFSDSYFVRVCFLSGRMLGCLITIP